VVLLQGPAASWAVSFNAPARGNFATEVDGTVTRDMSSATSICGRYFCGHVGAGDRTCASPREVALARSASRFFFSLVSARQACYTCCTCHMVAGADSRLCRVLMGVSPIGENTDWVQRALPRRFRLFFFAAVAWGLGVLLRYCVLFPLRLLALVLGLLLVVLLFPAVKLLGKVINVSRWEIL